MRRIHGSLRSPPPKHVLVEVPALLVLDDERGAGGGLALYRVHWQRDERRVPGRFRGVGVVHLTGEAALPHPDGADEVELHELGAALGELGWILSGRKATCTAKLIQPRQPFSAMQEPFFAQMLRRLPWHSNPPSRLVAHGGAIFRATTTTKYL